MLTKKLRKTIGQELVRLTGFIVCVILYFSIVREDTDVFISSLLKCLPIIMLMVFVFVKGYKYNMGYKYSHLVMLALVFSCLGDLLLNIDQFPLGMGAFAVAQIFYITAFELKPWKFWIGIPLYLVAGALVAFIFSSLDQVIKIGLPVYAFLLITMCWRSIVRATVRNDTLARMCAVGSVLFVISDTMISVNMFVTPLPIARILIMTTYYAAQLLIAVSTLSDVLKPSKVKGSKKLSRKYRGQN